jgi:hypothetical protein
MMEAARSSETLVNCHQTIRRYASEGSLLHSHRHEILKSYSVWSPSVSRFINSSCSSFPCSTFSGELVLLVLTTCVHPFFYLSVAAIHSSVVFSFASCVSPPTYRLLYRHASAVLAVQPVTQLACTSSLHQVAELSCSLAELPRFAITTTCVTYKLFSPHLYEVWKLSTSWNGLVTSGMFTSQKLLDGFKWNLVRYTTSIRKVVGRDSVLDLSPLYNLYLTPGTNGTYEGIMGEWY